MTLPNFLVIGAYKSGTSSLQWYLRSHPEIFVPELKEPRFFAFDGEPEAEARSNPMYPGAVVDLADYERLFDGVTTETAIGEVSPEYLKHAPSAERIKARIPEVKLIAVLRNPVQRAFSDYLMYRRDGREHEVDFLTALNDQERRRAAEESTGQYLVTGHYADQLDVYYGLFDRSRIKVVLQDDLIANRDATMAELFAFLGVDESFSVAPEPTLNRSGVFTDPVSRTLYAARRRVAPLVRNVVPATIKQRIDERFEARLTKPEFDPEAEQWLRSYYAEQITRTAQLTGLDLSRWTADQTEIGATP